MAFFATLSDLLGQHFEALGTEEQQYHQQQGGEAVRGPLVEAALRRHRQKACAGADGAAAGAEGATTKPRRRRIVEYDDPAEEERAREEQAAVDQVCVGAFVALLCLSPFPRCTYTQPHNFTHTLSLCLPRTTTHRSFATRSSAPS